MAVLSIIIPAYNEEKHIEAVLQRVKAVDLTHLGLKKEIIVISDGSKDKTAEIARKSKRVKVIEQHPNQGKGAAVRRGILETSGDIILIQDADLEYNPEEYPNIVAPILEGRAQIVYGSRFLGAKKSGFLFSHKHEQAYPLAYLGARIVTFTTNLLFHTNITDEATCYKCFKAEIIKNISITKNKFDWEPEVTAKIAKKGIKIYEVPISYQPRSFTEGKKINWKDGVQALSTLVKYRFYD